MASPPDPNDIEGNDSENAVGWDEPPEYAGLVRPPVGSIEPIRDVPDEYVFRFEMGPAILAQLLERLAQVPAVPILDVEDAKYPGFYHIHYLGEPKYIGKSSRPLRSRLREHVSKLSGRWDNERDVPLNLSDVTVKYVFVEDPSLVDLSESTLISFFDEHGLAPWAGSGYGSKVTGAGRKGQRTSDWAALFPPNLDAELTAGGSEPRSMRMLIREIKKAAPVGLFIPRQHSKDFTAAHPEKVTVAKQSMTFEEWREVLTSLLAPGWALNETPQGWYVEPSEKG